MVFSSPQTSAATVDSLVLNIKTQELLSIETVINLVLQAKCLVVKTCIPKISRVNNDSFFKQKEI